MKLAEFTERRIEMATGSTSELSPMKEQVRLRERSFGHSLAGYWALTKPDINFLIAAAVVAGFCSAIHTTLQSFPYIRLMHTLLGTLLVACGAGALNQAIERPFDSLMRRTSRRPLVAGRISTRSALWFGISVAVVGVAYLALATDLLSGFIAGLTITGYLFVYTPLKRITPMCTFTGALPGAMAPLIGCAAASGTISQEVWILYLVLFLWQFPHFMAIAWMYRDDYDRAGYKVLPRCKGRHKLMRVQSLIPALLLVPISLIPTVTGHEGRIYFVGAMLLGSIFLFCAIRLAVDRSNHASRQLLFASMVYLPIVLLLTVLDQK